MDRTKQSTENKHFLPKKQNKTQIATKKDPDDPFECHD